LEVKYRETPNLSAVFVEHKAETPLGTAYCEGGGKYSNGVVGFFISLVCSGRALASCFEAEGGIGGGRSTPYGGAISGDM
jgi:hypothetical protein